MVSEKPPGLGRQLLQLPNLLTLSRLILVPFFVFSSLQGAFILAFAIFLAAAITDAFDGYIARRYDLGSPLGAILDPAADKTMMVSGYVVYSFASVAPHHLPIWLTGVVFFRDLSLVVAAWFIYRRFGAKKFDPTGLGKLSTITQVVALATTVAANTPLDILALPLLLPVQVVAFVLTVISGFDYVRVWVTRVRAHRSAVEKL